MNGPAGAIYLIRHGETVWNVEGRRQGQGDSPLTPLGVEQASAAGRALRAALGERPRIRIESSPLGRARSTAEILCRELGLPESAIMTQPLLAELHHGEWEGLTAREIDARFPGARAARERDKWDHVIPGGESYAAVHVRVRVWLAAPKPPIPTLAVTHEMLSRTLQGAYAGYGRAETLALSHPHGRILRLWDGKIAEGAE